MIANLQDTYEIRQLLELCYAASPVMFDLFFRNLYSSSATFVKRDKGKIVSCVQLYPAACRLHSRPIRCGVVVGMATHPDYRNRGLMRQLFEEVCAEAVARNYCFIFVPQRTNVDSSDSPLTRLGFEPSFCRSLDWVELPPSKRGFCGDVVNIEYGEPMLTCKHHESSYVSLEPDWIGVVPSINSSGAYHAKILKTFSGLKSALMIWRDLSPDSVEVLYYYGRRDTLLTLLRISGYAEGTHVGFPVAEFGKYAGMIYRLSDRFSKEQLDTLFCEVSF